VRKVKVENMPKAKKINIFVRKNSKQIKCRTYAWILLFGIFRFFI